MRFLASIVLALLAAATGAGSGARAAPQAQVSDDQFSASATFVGPQKTINPFGGTTRTWRLRAWLDKASHAVTYQLYVDTDSLWRRSLWNEAADDHANPHRVVRIGTDKYCFDETCDYTEDVGIDLDDAFVRGAAATGFQIKLSGQSGDELVLKVAPGQIEPVLASIDSYLAAANPAAPQPPPGGVAMGVTFIDLPPLMASMMERPGLKGALISSVLPDSAAQRAGLLVGDIVTSYAGNSIAGGPDLVAAVHATKAGSNVALVVIRGGKDVPVALTF